MFGISKASGDFQIWDFQRVQTSDFVDFSFPIQETNLNECCNTPLCISETKS